MWLCVYTRRGIGNRTRSIFAAAPNISVPISTERIPPSRYSSAATATPGYCSGGTWGRNHGHPVFREVIAEVRRRRDAIAQVILLQRLLQPNGNRFQVASG